MTNLVNVISAVLSASLLKVGDSHMGRTPHDNLFNQVVRLDRASDAAWTACATREALAARQAAVREKTVAAIGGFPAKTPLNPVTTGIVKKDGYVIEKVLFESRPEHYVTAHLFLPDDPKYTPPYPGVVSPCGHSITGKNAPWYQRVGVTGAKLGLATLVYDPIDQGERRQRKEDPWHGSVTGHNVTGIRAHLLGWNVAQFRVWDGIRSFDYLASRPEVDAARIGVTGLSGGGTLSSYMNALDGRYAAGAPAGFLSTIRDVYANVGPGDAEQVIFGQAKYGLNHLGITVLRAPSPTMIVATHGDYFPFMGSIDTYENAKKVYAVLGAEDRVALMEAAGPHHWYESTRHAAMYWLRRWAGGDASAWPRDLDSLRRMDFAFDYTATNSGLAFEKGEVKNVTKTGSTLDIPGSRSVYDIMRDELAKLEKGRVEPTPATVRSVCGARPLSELSATPAAVRTDTFPGGRTVNLILLRDDDLTPIPLRMFLPDEAKGIPVLLLTDGMSADLAGDVASLLGGHRPVAVAELRGFGGTARTRYSFYGAKRADEELAMLANTIGENLVARRAEDAALAARYFSSQTADGRVALTAYGVAAIPAAHAWFLERNLFVSYSQKREPPSWRAVLLNPGMKFAFADSVYGALKVYDWSALAR